MRWFDGRRMLVLAVLAVASGPAGCKRSEPDRHDVGQAELHSGELPPPPQKPVVEESSYLRAVRREQVVLEARLRDRLEAIDGRVAALRVGTPEETRASGRFVAPDTKNERRVRALLERRSQLERDLGAVERADERGWDELKANVERDLDEGVTGDRM